MIKVIRTTIVCLLIPSLVFAQIPHYRANEQAVKQTDLARVWNALNTEVGQQIVSSIETTVGSINLEKAKAFTTAEGEVAFVPIKSFSKELVALCYRHLEDGSEYLFLITYNSAEKGVSFTFPSGRMYVMQANGAKESINPDFQFQPYDDLNNKVRINYNGLITIILFSCIPVWHIMERLFIIMWAICSFAPNLMVCQAGKLTGYFLMSFGPLLFVFLADSYPDLNLEMISILFAVYYYGCFFPYILANWESLP
jgi:hypothetical protein